MAYYNTVRNPSTFLRVAKSANAMGFADLQDSTNWQGAASVWGVEYLFAHRVICKEPCENLPLLHPKIKSGMEDGVDPCIDALLKGPSQDLATLSKMEEPKIVRHYENGNLGAVWAALAPLLRPDRDVTQTAATDRPMRERRETPRFGGMVSSSNIHTGTTPEDRPGSAASGAPSSIGYIQTSSAPLLEDLTVHFARCLIRCVLNYSQPAEEKSPLVHYRDERLTYGYVAGEKRVEAIDDGGVQINGKTKFQVAMLEAKRNFQQIDEGRPTVSDELLAQLVGEVLALRMTTTAKAMSGEKFISFIIVIVAVKHYIKFFQFDITDVFIKEYQLLLPTAKNPKPDTFLEVHSTDWLDMSVESGRRRFVRHLLALVAWADGEVAAP